MTDRRDNNAPWARSTLIIRSNGLSIDDIGQKIGQPTTNPRIDTGWVADLEPDSAVLLIDQLPAVERFLNDKINVLEELSATCQIELRIGWTPRVSQDGIVIEQTLIRLLHRINADVIIDTYTGCEYCQLDADD